MEAFVTGLHVILCLFLILVVLLQPGKGADFGAMMGGSTGQTGSAAQGATLIGKLTAVVAALFMVTSMSLAWFSNQGRTSVMSDDALQQELLEQEAEQSKDEGADAPDTAPTTPDEAPAPAPSEGGEGAGDGSEGAGDGADAPAGDPAPADEDAPDEDAPEDEVTE